MKGHLMAPNILGEERLFVSLLLTFIVREKRL